LLHKTNIHSDVSDIQKDEMLSYIRQVPNSKIFGLFRFQLGLYNFAGKNAENNWNKFWMRFGEAPVIYDERLTAISAQQLQKLFINKGYLNSSVDVQVSTNNKKAVVNYAITANKPYTVGKYSVAIDNPVLQRFATDTLISLIQSNMHFDSEVLDSEMQRISDGMRNRGYYNFNKDFLILLADSTNKGNKIDITLDIRRYLKRNPDTLSKYIFKRFKTEKIYFHTNQDANLLADNQNFVQQIDTLSKSGYYIIDEGRPFVSLDALMHNTYIQPNTYYNDITVERTNAALNSLGPVKFANITFVQTGDSTLDCHIVIIQAKSFSTSLDLEGTQIAKYWGAAVGLGFVNKNTFGGAEALSVKSRLALERQDSIWAREISGQLALKFPKFLLPGASANFRRKIHANTEFSINASYQNRPKEFDALNFGAGMRYLWNRSRYQHSFELFNISYMQFDVAPEFRKNYIETGEYNRYNYDNRFIVRMGYNGSFTNYNNNRPLKNFSTYRYGFESAGNLLYGINKIFGTKVDENGNYNLFKQRYSQYLRGDVNIAYNQIFDKNNRFVYHFGFGVGLPYGNADIMPYERRFYAGGANSVRGWSENSLGPGAYQRMPNVRSRDYNQVGDLKLDLSMEYRAKMFWLLEAALFLDAGNIWTIRNYPEQKDGMFAFDTFLNQIALAYGGGLRLDLSMFIFRMDVGVRLFDPAIMQRTEQWRISPKINRDFAIHIAIGYPF
jgi:outer membrane protein assembly factor BamA